MLVISGQFTIDAQAASAINTNFLQQDKPVIICTEDYNNLNAIITAASGATVAQNINYFTTNGSGGSPNGNAPVYQWNTTADGILNGGISDLRNAYWGCDGPGGPIAWDRNSPTVFTSYSNGTNQSGGTDTPPPGYPPMANLSSMFRMNAYPFIWISDNGFMASSDQAANAWHPSYIVSGTGVLMGKNNYGGGGTRRTISNSELIGNITAWAIMRRTTQN
jgi:hypothetical protein